ncbi:hypothetical protein ACE2AJ_04905 [Aquihabitans daechungensis]|uniref:hypothetical protein n=1 Tax=Aquihabitans daechungensis TaxID=1052257 RepID=UPI003B9EB42A
MGDAGELWVGVTGHRALADRDQVIADVDAALDRLLDGSARPLVAVSSLAEGADRIVAQRILARPGSRLIALLPLRPVDYILDFADAASVQEFTDLVAVADEREVIEGAPSDDWTREAAYERAGHAMLDRCDVLLALWDGKPGKGRGGTADMVFEAGLIGKPVEVITVERA